MSDAAHPEAPKAPSLGTSVCPHTIWFRKNNATLAKVDNSGAKTSRAAIALLLGGQLRPNRVLQSSDLAPENVFKRLPRPGTKLRPGELDLGRDRLLVHGSGSEAGSYSRLIHFCITQR